MDKQKTPYLLNNRKTVMARYGAEEGIEKYELLIDLKESRCDFGLIVTNFSP